MMPCSSWSNKLIKAKDHASVQLNVGHLGEDGVYNGNFSTIALAGNVRAMVSGSLACLSRDLHQAIGALRTRLHLGRDRCMTRLISISRLERATFSGGA